MDRIPGHLCEKYKKSLLGYADIFSRFETDLGKADVIPQKITLIEPAKVTCVAPYRLAPHLRVVAEEYIDKMLAAKIIRPSHSPYASPLMLVRKAVKLDPLNPLKGYRVVLDYRKVNANTVPDSYPCLLYTSPSPRDKRQSRMPSSA